MRRQTRQRAVIEEQLYRLASHPTATELYEMIRRRLPHVSLGTVYRNLELLAREGRIRKIEMGHGRARFDADTRPHYHVRCVRCRRVADIHGVPAELAPDGHASRTDYEILSLKVEFVGICPRCKELLTPAEMDRLRREWQENRSAVPSDRRGADWNGAEDHV